MMTAVFTKSATMDWCLYDLSVKVADIIDQSISTRFSSFEDDMLPRTKCLATKIFYSLADENINLTASKLERPVRTSKLFVQSHYREWKSVAGVWTKNKQGPIRWKTSNSLRTKKAKQVRSSEKVMATVFSLFMKLCIGNSFSIPRLSTSTNISALNTNSPATAKLRSQLWPNLRWI